MLNSAELEMFPVPVGKIELSMKNAEFHDILYLRAFKILAQLS